MQIAGSSRQTHLFQKNLLIGLGYSDTMPGHFTSECLAMRKKVRHQLQRPMEMCVAHAKETKRMSVQRIADEMQCSSWMLYKWLGTGRMPASVIPAFEDACGCSFITRHLARTSNLLLIDRPSAGMPSPREMINLQQDMVSALEGLQQLSEERCRPEDTVGMLMQAMESLAYHEKAVRDYAQAKESLASLAIFQATGGDEPATFTDEQG